MKSTFSTVFLASLASLAAARQVRRSCPGLNSHLTPRPRLHSAVHSAQRLSFHDLVHLTSPLVLVLIALFRPAIFTDLNVGSAVPDVETGWEGKHFLASLSLCVYSA